MNRETSVYLDLVRFSAAIVVFLSHVGGQKLTGGLLWQLTPYGGEAVVVFFVLSGFVIGYATDKREATAASYFINRAARLYSVVVPALLLTLVLDTLGRILSPAAYAAWWSNPSQGPIQFLRALTFTNEVWVSAGGPGSNIPFWSLGYEASYYLAFSLLLFASQGWRWLWAALALLIAGPDVAYLFPIWLFGVGAYYGCTHRNVGQLMGWVLLMAPLGIWAAYEVHSGIGRPALAHQELVSQDYIIGALFTAHLIGFQTVSARFAGVLLPLAPPIRWLSGATFSIYLFHFPLAQFLGAASPWEPSSWQQRALLILGTPCLALLLAEVSERQKDWWRGLLSMMFERKAVLPTG